jgi:hypothetical protein
MHWVQDVTKALECLDQTGLTDPDVTQRNWDEVDRAAVTQLRAAAGLGEAPAEAPTGRDAANLGTVPQVVTWAANATGRAAEFRQLTKIGPELAKEYGPIHAYHPAGLDGVNWYSLFTCGDGNFQVKRPTGPDDVSIMSVPELIDSGFTGVVITPEL